MSIRIIKDARVYTVLYDPVFTKLSQAITLVTIVGEVTLNGLPGILIKEKIGPYKQSTVYQESSFHCYDQALQYLQTELLEEIQILSKTLVNYTQINKLANKKLVKYREEST